ncbi:MAG: prepilin-type N-terminal cleavage/methylation domain-containing protein [Planctomycetota bacterium]|jgi:prepilin-type N-terminal cleavage/methylation domain-containing protein
MKKAGFTLIEALIAVVIISIAIVALLAANSAFTQANAIGTELSTAEFLVEQIKELTATLPVIDPNTGAATFGAEEAALVDYDDLDDFDDMTFSPPINADRTPLNDFAAFSQQITVQNVHPGDFEQVVADHGSEFVRVTVTVFLNSENLSSASWIRAKY